MEVGANAGSGVATGDRLGVDVGDASGVGPTGGLRVGPGVGLAFGNETGLGVDIGNEDGETDCLTEGLLDGLKVGS